MTTAEEQSALERTLAPRSIAVVGASQDGAKLGGKVLANLEASFDGALYAINPRAERVDGRARWLTAPSDLPDGVDLMVLAVPPATVTELIGGGLLARRLGGVAVLAEPANDPSQRQAFERGLADYVTRTGTRVLGPNTSGFRAYRDGILATFAGDVDARVPAATETVERFATSPVSLVSQSGAMLAYLGGTLLSGRNVGLDYVIDTGNEVDVTAADCLGFLSRRAAHRVGLVLEGTRDWRSFRTAVAAAVKAGVVVVALQVGRSAAGRAISASHTGAVGGSAGAFRAALEAAGAVVADDENAFLDALTIDPARVAGRRPEVFLGSFSGGMNALIADQLAESGLRAMPDPADFGPAALRDDQPIRAFLREAGQSATAAATILFTGHVTKMDRVGPALFAAICAEAAQADHPVVVVGKRPHTPRTPVPHNLLVVDTPSSAVRGLATVLRAHTPVRAADPADPVGTAVAWTAAQQLLADGGIAVAETRVATSADEAVAAAAELGLPVVLKVDAPSVLHRARSGLVKVGLADRKAVQDAYGTLAARCALLRLDGAVILVQPMVPIDVELFVGVRLVDAFGPTVILSLGGGDVEADNRLRIQLPVPLEPAQASNALARLGIEPVTQLVATVVAICAVAAELPDATVLEVNPLCVSARHPAGVAVDCVILQPMSVR